MASFLDAFRAGKSAGDDISDSYFGAKDRAQKWKEMLSEKADAKETAAAHYQDTRDDKDEAEERQEEKDIYAENHAKKKDELYDAEIASIKSGRGKNGTSSARRSPALIGLQEQYKQLSNDVRQKTQPGSHPPIDLVKRYNAVGKAFNAQLKHEDPSSVEVDFVPMPEPTAPAPGSDGFHPINWFKKVTGLSDSGVNASGTVVTKYKNGKPIQVIDHGDGTFSPVQ